MAWSGGKDSAMGLDEVLNDSNIEAEALITVFSEHSGRTSIHGVRESLIEKQAEEIGLPLEKIWIKEKTTEKEFEKRLKEKLSILKEEYDIEAVIYSDIFLEDIKEKREKLLREIELEGVFPIWGRDTKELLNEFLEDFQGLIVTVDEEKAPVELVGKEFSAEIFEKDLDPCGEKGEFHSFVFDAPFFDEKIEISRGDEKRKKTEEGHSVYQDIESV